MPTTYNGIGTHYYGKRDRSSRDGTCQHCGGRGKLETYTTRLWFVIIFIPVIPLKRVRILDYCPHCSRHWAVNPEQYEMSKQLAVSGAIEKHRQEGTVESALTVHAEMLSYHMHEESNKFREAVQQQISNNADLTIGLAQQLEQMGRWTEATPLYEKAFEWKPESPDVRYSLAWRRTHEGKLDEAYELIDYLRQPGSGQSFNLQPLETLAVAYQKKGQHEKVIDLSEHLLREAPDAGKKFAFRKMVAASELALKRDSSILPEQTKSVRGLFDFKNESFAPWVRWVTFGSIALVLFLIGMMGLNEYQRTRRTIHIISGFAQPIQVSIDGAAPLTVTNRTVVPISEGKHRFDMTGPFTRTIEQDLHSPYFSRWLSSPIWVLDIANAAGVSVNTLKYAVNPTPGSQLFLEDELSFVPHVDYLFEQPPQTLKVERGATITKIHVEWVPMEPSNTFIGFRSNPDTTIAMVFAEGHLERNPNDAVLLAMYSRPSKNERVRRFLTERLWKEPISVAWHRSYQDRYSTEADETELTTKYDELLKNNPNNSDVIYLRGRVAATSDEELKFYQQGIGINPESGWNAAGIASISAGRGDWQEAKKWCDKAAVSLGKSISIRRLNHFVTIGSGQANQLEAGYQAALNGRDFVELITAANFLADAMV
ncbi:MAG: hypothetical protein FJ267_01635, partial [Planctomycetes bacterium]|nr:hypothetical protein [Planctomycetota bacterium]